MIRTGLATSFTTAATTRIAYRAFSFSATRTSGHGHDDHHHEEPTPEEHLADNPKYIAVAGLITGTFALLGFDNYYSKWYGHSYFGQLIHPTPSAQVASENVLYQDNLNKGAEVYEVLMTTPVKSPFRDAPSVQAIRRGSPFNREPGSSVDIDSLSPRRELKRSIFD